MTTHDQVYMMGLLRTDEGLLGPECRPSTSTEELPLGTLVPFVAKLTEEEPSITGNTKFRHMNICTMELYEDKSFEELRVEDYLRGRQRAREIFSFNYNNPFVQKNVRVFGQSLEQLGKPQSEIRRSDCFKKIVLDPNSPEYTDVLNRIFQTATSDAHIVKVEKIDNEHLTEQYCVLKKKVEKDIMSLPVNSVSPETERMLFHGTDECHIEDICADGFNRIYGGDRHGMLYGQGTYFARDFVFSSNYAHPDPHTKIKHILLCKVLTGCFILGSKYLKVLPINPANGAKYHSAVNKVENPSIFAIFHDSAAVPVYLISYSSDDRSQCTGTVSSVQGSLLGLNPAGSNGANYRNPFRL